MQPFPQEFVMFVPVSLPLVSPVVVSSVTIVSVAMSSVVDIVVIASLPSSPLLDWMLSQLPASL